MKKLWDWFLVKQPVLLYFEIMILHKYILRNHFIPFLFSVLTLIGIFILQFFMKFADRLVGKGLDVFIIIKLIVFNLAWMLVLVIPMASLVATLMAFGAMSQNNEITIIKSSGTSLYKMMLAPIAASIVIGYFLFIFNNDVLPDANHQAKVLMQDISRQKPTLSLEPGVFSQEVNNYAILVRNINQKNNELFEVTIYDYTVPGKINVVTAEQGRLYFSKDQTKLIMDLKNGEIHETDIAETSLYRKLVFENHRITMNAENFTFQQSGPVSRGEREMSVEDMQFIVDSLYREQAKIYASLQRDAFTHLFADTVLVKDNLQKQRSGGKNIYSYSIVDKINTTKNIILSRTGSVSNTNDEINKFKVEIYKKYALPAACIVFVLIGAPLGVMVRKGGFGVAGSISLFFFLIYWAFLIGGEKLAERSIFSPFLGMWAANILLSIAGAFLVYRSVKETVTINFNFLRKLLPKQWREIQEAEDEKESDENYR